jgi:hypothetical protein
MGFIMIDKRYDLTKLPGSIGTLLVKLAQHGDSFTRNELQMLCGSREKWFTRQIKPLMNSATSSQQGFGAAIKEIEGRYYINPYYLFEGKEKQTLIKRFCFDGGLPYPRDFTERRRFYAWMRIYDNITALPTEALMMKKVEQLDPEIGRVIDRVIRVREGQIRDEQLEISEMAERVA